MNASTAVLNCFVGLGVINASMRSDFADLAADLPGGRLPLPNRWDVADGLITIGVMAAYPNHSRHHPLDNIRIALEAIDQATPEAISAAAERQRRAQLERSYE